MNVPVQPELLRWAREFRGVSQAQAAAAVVERFPTLEYNTVLFVIKNVERGRKKKLTTEFLQQFGEALNLRDDWHIRNFRNDVVNETRPQYSLQRIANLRIPRAPADRATTLRTQFVADRNAWKRTSEVPFDFVISNFDDPEPDDRYPTLFADVIEEGDELSPPLFRIGDVLAIRSDLNPQLGHVVLATTKDGRRVRRIWQVVDGAVKLLPMTTFYEPLLLRDIVAIEGIVCGRYRAPKNGAKSSVFWAEGLCADDLY